MAILQHYYRPETVTEAVALLQRRDQRLAPLAGGAQLVGELELRRKQVDGVVDLSRLGLGYVETDGVSLRIGATATLSDLAAHPQARALAEGILSRTARGEGPLNLRNAATVGGLVAAAAYDSELYAALLALDAAVAWHDGALQQSAPLAALEGAPGLILEIHLPLEAQSSGHARVARTPADRPIVAAVAVRGPQGTRVALCGVASRPLLSSQPFDPPGDFKGSAAYRRAMAEVVVTRALTQLAG